MWSLPHNGIHKQEIEEPSLLLPWLTVKKAQADMGRESIEATM
jgi:putative alpha-1,2-mannosidase